MVIKYINFVACATNGIIMQNTFENSLIGKIASSILSPSAIQRLVPHIKEILNSLSSFSEEYRDGYLSGFIEGFLMGYFQVNNEIADRMKKANMDKDFIAKVTGLDPEIE